MGRAKGNIAEDRAASFLQEHGFFIIERNFYSRFGEIDIIASKNDVLHFVEVKSALSYELAIQNITSKKMSRLIRTGDIFMKKNILNVAYEYDAIIVTPKEIELVQNITL